MMVMVAVMAVVMVMMAVVVMLSAPAPGIVVMMLSATAASIVVMVMSVMMTFMVVATLALCSSHRDLVFELFAVRRIAHVKAVHHVRARLIDLSSHLDHRSS